MIAQEINEDSFTCVLLTDVGQNHTATGIPNQDSVANKFYGNDFVLCVSDGVGSCKMAKEGSCYAVESCIKVFDMLSTGLLDFDGEKIVETILEYWKRQIQGANINEYCATLKVAIKHDDILKLISIGDGIVSISSEGEWLIAPDEDRTFTNETHCLSSYTEKSDFWIRDFYVGNCKSFAVFCCTDGISNGILSGSEFALVNSIEREIKRNDLRLELENFTEEISHYCFDDKTLGVIKYERTN